MTAMLSTLQAARRERMGLLARAEPARLESLMPEMPPHDWLRPPEIGTAMVRGRVGATGDAFNLGEMTVTRCALRLSGGEIGHGWVQGRNKGHATRAALIDALMQTDAAPRVTSDILDPLARDEAARRESRAARAAATRVEFFTMVRGEDQ